MIRHVYFELIFELFAHAFKNLHFDSIYNFFLIGQLLLLCNDTVSPIAPVPSSIDRDDYYFIGALIALSNAVICAANQILIAKVK